MAGQELGAGGLMHVCHCDGLGLQHIAAWAGLDPSFILICLGHYAFIKLFYLYRVRQQTLCTLGVLIYISP